MHDRSAAIGAQIVRPCRCVETVRCRRSCNRADILRQIVVVVAIGVVFGRWRSIDYDNDNDNDNDNDPRRYRNIHTHHQPWEI